MEEAAVELKKEREIAGESIEPDTHGPRQDVEEEMKPAAYHHTETEGHSYLREPEYVAVKEEPLDEDESDGVNDEHNFEFPPYEATPEPDVTIKEEELGKEDCESGPNNLYLHVIEEKNRDEDDFSGSDEDLSADATVWKEDSRRGAVPGRESTPGPSDVLQTSRGSQRSRKQRLPTRTMLDEVTSSTEYSDGLEKAWQKATSGENRGTRGGSEASEDILYNERKFICKFCGKKFPRSVNFERHIRLHLGDKPFSCTECGKTFAMRSDLTRHLRTHNGEKRFCCPTCGKAFSESGNLKMHKRTHTGERPYKCSVCGAAFMQVGHLESHRRTHTGEKPFKCLDCGKAFAESSHLSRHRRIHSGERPFVCSECGKTFSISGNLSRHLVRMHKSKSSVTEEDTYILS